MSNSVKSLKELINETKQYDRQQTINALTRYGEDGLVEKLTEKAQANYEKVKDEIDKSRNDSSIVKDMGSTASSMAEKMVFGSSENADKFVETMASYFSPASNVVDKLKDKMSEVSDNTQYIGEYCQYFGESVLNGKNPMDEANMDAYISKVHGEDAIPAGYFAAQNSGVTEYDAMTGDPRFENNDGASQSAEEQARQERQGRQSSPQTPPPGMPASVVDEWRRGQQHTGPQAEPSSVSGASASANAGSAAAYVSEAPFENATANNEWQKSQMGASIGGGIPMPPRPPRMSFPEQGLYDRYDRQARAYEETSNSEMQGYDSENAVVGSAPSTEAWLSGMKSYISEKAQPYIDKAKAYMLTTQPYFGQENQGVQSEGVGSNKFNANDFNFLQGHGSEPSMQME